MTSTGQEDQQVDRGDNPVTDSGADSPASPGTAAPRSAGPVTGQHDKYWASNLKILGVLLSVWFLVSYGAAILFADALNHVRLPGTGFKLGFWFAQQGAIVTFVLLIAVYVLLMSRLDRKHGVEEA